MLEFNSPALPKEKTIGTLNVRKTKSFAELLERASVSLGVDASTFVRAAVEREAQRVLAFQAHHVMLPEDAIAFTAAVDAAPAPTPRALKAAARYQMRVVHAD